MSQMYVSHSRVAVDLGKILQCGSTENKTAKLVEDIASEYSVELQALRNLEYFELKKCIRRQPWTNFATNRFAKQSGS